jgi:predicted transcriptional regulator
MSDEQPSASVDREFAARIVAAYVRHNQVASEQIASLILNVHRAIADLGKSPAEPTGERTPAVSIRRSVHRDYVVCLDCGLRCKMLRRHLMTAHGLSVDQYRARWSLAHDHALVAPAYRDRRSTMAKQIGLGRGGRRASGGATAPAASAAPAVAQPRTRGRPPSTATPA